MVANSASMADTDTMYLQQAMKQDNGDKFLKAMIKEIEDHTVQGHWRITTWKEMRERNYLHRPIAAIWSFKRKKSIWPDNQIQGKTMLPWRTNNQRCTLRWDIFSNGCMVNSPNAFHIVRSLRLVQTPD